MTISRSAQEENAVCIESAYNDGWQGGEEYVHFTLKFDNAENADAFYGAAAKAINIKP